MNVPPDSRAVAITGRGAVSSLGADRESLWAGIRAGTCGILPITRFDTDGFRVKTGAQAVPGALLTLPDHMNERDPAAAEAICLALSERALREALRDAGLWNEVSDRASRSRIAFTFGTGLSELVTPLHELVQRIAEAVGLDGARVSVSTACSSSTTAIGLGLDLIAMGSADIVVAGGADVLTPEVFAGFHALGVLTHTRCAPFSAPAGTSLGEGAGFLVLERETHATGRGAPVLAVLAGYGLSCDAWHETSPDPKGAGIERAIRGAITDAGVAASTIDYVNAHGSGTQANDSAEWLGIQRALGERTVHAPVSSTKGALGHAQGAAGVLEVIVTLEAILHRTIPPTLNFVGPRPHAPPDPVPGPFPRAATAERIVSINSAFGGANAALVLTRTHTPVGAMPRRAVLLRGLAVVGEFDLVDDERDVLGVMLPADELRRCDPSARALTAAVALALREADHRVTGGRRDRTGLFVGQRRPSPASLNAFADSVVANGLPQLSASAFARIVLNAAAGTCARLLSLRGPHTAITTGAASGLTAVVLAAEHLATRGDVEALVAAGVDERYVGQSVEVDDTPDGAIAVLLASVPDPAAGLSRSTVAQSGVSPPPAVRLDGWGVAGPDDLEHAMGLAAPDGLPAGTLRLSSDLASPGACSALILLAKAVRALRAGTHEHVLVTSTDPAALSAALLLSR